MPNAEFIWDLDDEPDGNVQHIAEHGVTVKEAEEVVRINYEAAVASGSSGRPTVFGSTITGRYLAVVFEIIDDGVPEVYVVTTYDAPPPAEPKRRRKKR